MSASIGLIGDVHATAAPLREAFIILENEGVDMVLCTGDLAGYGTELEQSIELLVENDCKTIKGNHDAWYVDRQEEEKGTQAAQFLKNLPLTWKTTLEGKLILAVHASPPNSMSRGITLLDQYEKIMPSAKKKWTRELAGYNLDVLIVGHTHQAFSEMFGQTLVINPGSTKFNHTCAILNLPDMEVRTVPLSGKTPRKFWHWAI